MFSYSPVAGRSVTPIAGCPHAERCPQIYRTRYPSASRIVLGAKPGCDLTEQTKIFDRGQRLRRTMLSIVGARASAHFRFSALNSLRDGSRRVLVPSSTAVSLSFLVAIALCLKITIMKFD